MAGTNYTADKTAYNAAIDNDISTQTGANTIPPEVVGAGYTDLSNLLEPYINRINNQAILSGSSVPSSLTGSDLDLYYRSQPTFFELYRKEAGTWVLKVTINFSVTLPEGNLTVATSIDGFNALASKGGWVIANNVYQKATQTGILVDPADLNFYRHDIIYANTSNQILYLQGTAAASPITPSLPANTILIDEIVVPSSSSGFDPYLLFGGSGVNNISIDDVILNQDGFAQPADFRIAGTGEVGDFKITNAPSSATGTDLVLFRDPSTGAVKAGSLTTFELGANKQNNLNYDGTAVKYPTVDAVNDWTRKIATTATKTGLLSKLDSFNLTALDNFTARIAAIDSAMFWNEIFTVGSSPNSAIKSFVQKDYSLGQLITATGGNVNVNPLGADGKYVRYLGYDKNGNVYSSLASFASNNDILQLGFVTVLKSGATVSFLDGTAGPRNVFPQPNLASNTDFDKVSSTTTNVTVGRKSDASFSTSAGTITGISVNWKSAANPTNSNPIDVFSVSSQATASFVVVDPTFLTSTSAITTHTLLTDSDGGIPVNQSFFNTTTGLRGTMANGSAAVARIMIGVRGGIYWQMGEFATTACYADLTTAKNNIYSHVFTEAIVPPGVAFEIARVAFTKSASVTNNDAQFYLVNTSGGGSSSSSVSPVGDATTSTKGILKLAGDLGGTADLPTVLKITNTPDNISTIGTEQLLYRDASTGTIKKGTSILPENSRFDSSVTAIFAWGDSLTDGFSTTNYPTQLSTITNFAVTNKGVGGENSTQIKNRLVADTANYSKSVIIWAGRNNFTSPATVKADIATMVSTIGHSRYLILSILNKDTALEYVGGADYITITQLNSDLEAIYGSKYLDIRKILVNSYNPSIPQDVIDFGHDVPPSSLRLASDPLHLNTAGYSIVANEINRRLGYLFDKTGYLQSKDFSYYLNESKNNFILNNPITGIAQLADFFINNIGKARRLITNNAPGAQYTIHSVAGQDRWNFATSGTESGSNSGSDLLIQSHNDAGSFLANGIFIKRSNGNVIIGGTSDNGFKLDVIGAFRSKDIIDVYGGLGVSLFGSDGSSSTTRTNSTNKSMRIGVPHYLTAEEPMALFACNTTSTSNQLNIGGGSSVMNAATEIRFLLATNNTTVTGTELMKINSDGHITKSYKSSSAAPTTTDIASGFYAMWKNTTSGEVRLYANDGGTLKSVLLT